MSDDDDGPINIRIREETGEASNGNNNARQ